MDNVEFFYLPVDDLDRALRLYRDTLGWPEAWREGDTTASLKMPGDHVQLMLDQAPNASYRPGPVLLVDDVRAWYTSSTSRPSTPEDLRPRPARTTT